MFKPGLGPFDDDEPTDVTGYKPKPPEIMPPIVAAVTMHLKRKKAHPSNHGHAERVPKLIVIHSTEGHEGPNKDIDVSAMFARGDLEKKRSAHYVVDSDSVTHCVDDNLPAWHCGKTGNRLGIGIELCGRASQSYESWHDEFSLPMLCIAARLIAELCKRHGIPPVHVTSNELRAGASGITTHASISIAWGETNHTDPGKEFPMSKLVSAVAIAMRGAP